MNSNAVVVASQTAPVPLNTERMLSGLAEFLNINVAEGDAAERTIKLYMTHIGQFVAWCWDQDIDPALAKKADLALYRRDLVTTGLERSTIGVKLAAIRRLFDAAISHGMRKDNPATGVKPPRDHTTRRDRILERYISPDDVQALLETPDTSRTVGIRDLAILALFYYHGMRVSEVAALKLENLIDDRIHIVKSKGGKSRVLLLATKSRPILDDWLAARGELVSRHSNDAVFLSASRATRGNPLSVQGVRYVVNSHLRKSGIYRTGISCHALRHAHASHVLANGGDIYALAQSMGHSKITTTTDYLHVVSAVEQNPAEFL